MNLKKWFCLWSPPLDGKAYGVTVSQDIEQYRTVTFGSVHNTLIRLEEKGFVESEIGGATVERGGRRKRLFNVTALGNGTMNDIQKIQSQLWQLMPPDSLKISGA